MEVGSWKEKRTSRGWPEFFDVCEPLADVRKCAGEVNDSAGDINDPAGEANGAMGEINALRGRPTAPPWTSSAVLLVSGIIAWTLIITFTDIQVLKSVKMRRIRG